MSVLAAGIFFLFWQTAFTDSALMAHGCVCLLSVYDVSIVAKRCVVGGRRWYRWIKR